MERGKKQEKLKPKEGEGLWGIPLALLLPHVVLVTREEACCPQTPLLQNKLIFGHSNHAWNIKQLIKKNSIQFSKSFIISKVTSTIK